jgi:hypothetical protein
MFISYTNAHAYEFLICMLFNIADDFMVVIECNDIVSVLVNDFLCVVLISLLV